MLGPNHYEHGFNEGPKLNGKTKIKLKHLKEMGYKVILVDYGMND